MRGFAPNDFKDTKTYESNQIKLERAQAVARKVCRVRASITQAIPEGSGLYYELMGILEDAVQIGYEAALDMPHKASDYDITSRTLATYSDLCSFCTNAYYVYGCEQNCARSDKGLDCQIEVKENL